MEQQILKISGVGFGELSNGEVKIEDFNLEKANGVIILGYVYDAATPPNKVEGAPVILLEDNVPIGYALTESDGFYMFGIKPVNEGAVYIIKTTANSSRLI